MYIDDNLNLNKLYKLDWLLLHVYQDMLLYKTHYITNNYLNKNYMMLKKYMLNTQLDNQHIAQIDQNFYLDIHSHIDNYTKILLSMKDMYLMCFGMFYMEQYSRCTFEKPNLRISHFHTMRRRNCLVKIDMC